MTARRWCPLAVCALLLVLLAACTSSGRTVHPRATTATSAAPGGPAAAPAPGRSQDSRSQGSGDQGSGGQDSGGPDSGTYVAIGDSFTAAPIYPRQGGAGAACQRSAKDYPYLVAAALHPASFANVSCYGATTRDISHAQHTGQRPNPPQLNALSAAVSVVTVQIGGDDIGFSGIATTCGALSLTDVGGDPCRQHYTRGGTDQLAQAVTRAAPQVAAVLAAIRQRAPRARVLVVGYPDILPVRGRGCWPELTVARGDLPYLRGMETQLNAMLAAQAAGAHDTFVDTYTPSIGHDACQRGGVKWVEGLIPTSAAVPLHPNARGEQAMAREILAALR